MKKVVLPVMVLIVVAFFCYNYAYPANQELSVWGKRVDFSRKFDWQAMMHVYCNGEACLAKGDYIIVLEDGKLREYYYDGSYLRKVPVFEGPIYVVNEVQLKEVGFSHQRMSRTTEDELQCLIWDNIGYGTGLGCTSFTQEIEWYNRK